MSRTLTREDELVRDASRARLRLNEAADDLESIEGQLIIARNRLSNAEREYTQALEELRQHFGPEVPR